MNYCSDKIDNENLCQDKPNGIEYLFFLTSSSKVSKTYLTKEGVTLWRTVPSLVVFLSGDNSTLKCSTKHTNLYSFCRQFTQLNFWVPLVAPPHVWIFSLRTTKFRYYCLLFFCLWDHTRNVLNASQQIYKKYQEFCQQPDQMFNWLINHIRHILQSFIDYMAWRT